LLLETVVSDRSGIGFDFPGWVSKLEEMKSDSLLPEGKVYLFEE
jgi:hypothetical protein